MTLAADTSRQIGTHRHNDGSIHSGLDVYGGCDICTLALDWLDMQHAAGVSDVWHEPELSDLLKAELKRRGLSQPLPRKTFINPHKPQELVEEEQPSLDKIKTRKKPSKPVVEAPATPQVELVMQALMTTVSANESEVEPEPIPQPPAPTVPVFKLTNPDEHTITRIGRRKKGR